MRADPEMWLAEDVRAINAERERLEREVIKAAKAWAVELRRINNTTYSDENRIRELIKSPVLLVGPIHALEEFESEHEFDG